MDTKEAEYFQTSGTGVDAAGACSLKPWNLLRDDN